MRLFTVTKLVVAAVVLIACQEQVEATEGELERVLDGTGEPPTTDRTNEPVPAPRRTIAELEAHRERLEAAAVRADVRFGRAGRAPGERLGHPVGGEAATAPLPTAAADVPAAP